MTVPYIANSPFLLRATKGVSLAGLHHRSEPPIGKHERKGKAVEKYHFSTEFEKKGIIAKTL